jgi:hypothetical protein
MKFSAATILAAVAGVSATDGKGTSPYGSSHYSTSPYGSPTYSTPYGNPTYSTPYGTPTHSTPYGTPTYSTPYGTPTYSTHPYGTGYNSPVMTTVTVTGYTTVCPEATTFTYGTKVYSATAGQTVTIEGPCTLVYPMTTTSNVYCNECSQPTGYPVSQEYPVSTLSSVYYPPVQTTYQPTSSSSPYGGVVTAGAAQLVAMSGAGLAGLLGLAVFVL